MTQLEDSVAGQTGTTSFGGASPPAGRTQLGVVFTTSANPLAELNRALFWLGSTGAPTGPLTLAIYTVSGTIGVNAVPGSLLATSDALDGSDPAGALLQFLFSAAARIALAGTTSYFLVADGRGVTGGTGTLTGGRTDPEPGPDDGTAVFDGSWSFFTADNVFNFEVYTAAAAPAGGGGSVDIADITDIATIG